jgi:hypothetical protein
VSGMDDPDSEILIETMRIGNALEVRAISSGDGLEVSFQAPASTAEADIHRLARAKLGWVRKRNGPEEPDDDSGTGRGGVIV